MPRPARRGVVIAAIVVSAAMPLLVVQAQTSDRVLVAIFAHPDDEIPPGPMLAMYAREGADVRLVLATNGERGTGVSKIPAGEALGRARAQEAMCSAVRLGIKPPVLLDLGDGVLAVAATLGRLEAEIARVLKELRPRVVLTWGPEGLDGHPDHRIVGAVVTQVVQGWADGDPPALYSSRTSARTRSRVEDLGDLPPALRRHAVHCFSPAAQLSTTVRDGPLLSPASVMIRKRRPSADTAY